MEGFRVDVLKGVREEIAQLETRIPSNTNDNANASETPPEGIAVPTYCNSKYRAFCYAEYGSTDRKFWMVPKNFSFPSVDRRAAWTFWLLGLPENESTNPDGTIVAHPICPFRFFKPALLPLKPRNHFKNNWRPVLSIMEDAIVSGDSHPTQMDSQEIEMLWEAGNDLLKGRASYIFAKPRYHLWSVSTCSKHVKSSFIKKYGTDQDKTALPPEASTWLGMARPYKKRRSIQATLTRHPRRSNVQQENDTQPHPPPSGEDEINNPPLPSSGDDVDNSQPPPSPQNVRNETVEDEADDTSSSSEEHLPSPPVSDNSDDKVMEAFNV